MDSNERKRMYAAIGIAQGIQNLQKISRANQELESKRQRFDLDRKVIESRLNREALDMDPDIVEQRRRLLKAQIKAQESQFTLNEIKIAEAQRQEKQKVDTYGTMMNIIQNATAQGDMSGVSIDSTGKMSYSGGKKTIHSGDDLPTKDVLVALNNMRKNRAYEGVSQKSQEEMQLESIVRSRLGKYGSASGDGNGQSGAYSESSGNSGETLTPIEKLRRKYGLVPA